MRTKEKHVPVIERNLGMRSKKLAWEVLRIPMEDKHFIEWIEILDGDTVYRRYLVPGAKPEARFPVNSQPSG